MLIFFKLLNNKHSTTFNIFHTIKITVKNYFLISGSFFFIPFTVFGYTTKISNTYHISYNVGYHYIILTKKLLKKSDKTYDDIGRIIYYNFIK
jgi:hypothetical protein